MKSHQVEWREKPADLPGLWWWWNGDEDALPIVVDIMWSGTDGTFFAPHGQHGWTSYRDVEEMGGWWRRLLEPDLPPVVPNEPRNAEEEIRERSADRKLHTQLDEE